MTIGITGAAVPERPREADRGSVRGGLQAVVAAVVALMTAGVVLGPRAWVVDGRSAVSSWLQFHPWQQDAVHALGGVDAVGNALLIAPLGVLLAAWCRPRRAVALLPVLLLAPLAVERVQQQLPGRVPDPGDALRNAAGALVAVVAVLLLRLLHRALVHLDRLLGE